MFKFFNIFKKEEKEEIKADINEVDEILREKTKKIFNESMEKISPNLEELKNLLKKLKEISDELGSLSFPDMDKRLALRVETAIGILRQKIDSAWKKFSKNEDSLTDYNDVLSRKIFLEELLRDVSDVCLKQSNIVSICFRKQTNAIGSTLKNISRTFKNIKEEIERGKEKIDKINGILNLMKEIKSKKEHIESEKKSIEKKERDISRLSEELEKKKEEIEKISKDEDYLKRMESKKKHLEKKKDIEFEFRNDFSMFRKNLKKFKHDFGILFKKDEQEIMDSYCEDALEGYIKDNEEKIEKFLREMKSKMNVEGVEGIIEKIKIFRENYERLKKENNFGKVDETSRKIENLQKKIDSEKIELSKNKEEIESRSKGVEELKVKIEKMQKELRSNLNEVDIKLKEEEDDKDIH